MGYKVPARKPVVVTFGPPHEGLELAVRPSTPERLRAASRLSELSDGIGITDADAEIIMDLFESFTKALISWNLEDEDGELIPADRTGLDTLEDDFILTLVMGWLTTTATAGTDTYRAAAVTAGLQQAAADVDLAAGIPMQPVE